MPSYVPPRKNTEYIFYIALAAQSQVNTFQSNPTLASGDFKVSKDGGALANLTTLPAVTPASSVMVKVTVSSTEMNADNVTIVGSDASGAQWKDIVVNIQTSVQQIDDIPTAAAIADAVLDEAITEPAGVFAWAGGSLRNIIGWLGALSRNKVLQTATLSTLRNDADSADLSTSVVSDEGVTFTRGEWS